MAAAAALSQAHTGFEEPANEPKGLSMVVFSGDLDKVMGAFIIANAAAAMDMPVTMFFTFWGLNVLRRGESVHLKSSKTIVEKMFGRMMPRGPDHLTISQMNMAGMGTRMLKNEMRKKNIIPLSKLIEQAQAQGVQMIACEMSMQVMGIKKEELLPGVMLAGAATYVARADESRVSLFI